MSSEREEAEKRVLDTQKFIDENPIARALLVKYDKEVLLDYTATLEEYAEFALHNGDNSGHRRLTQLREFLEDCIRRGDALERVLEGMASKR